jgi:hypothetical protein
MTFEGRPEKAPVDPREGSSARKHYYRGLYARDFISMAEMTALSKDLDRRIKEINRRSMTRFQKIMEALFG